MTEAEHYKRICAYIDVDAAEYNIIQMKNNILPGTKLLGVIKADGYGHGAEVLGHALEKYDYIWGFAVATVDEAVLLRQDGIKKPILILGYVFPDQIDTVVNYDLTVTVFEKELASALSDKAVSCNSRVKVHIKLDTGMGRLGFRKEDDPYNTIREITELPGLEAEGVFSHFARADERDKQFAAQQLSIFNEMLDKLSTMGVSFRIRHIGASAGIIDVKNADFDMMRAGISIYGMYPSEEVCKENVPLKPVMSLISHVVYVKTVNEGTPISYGGTHVTDRRTRVATIPVGYGDGYPRLLSDKGAVLIKGQRAPILGRVCMDMFMVDVTDIPDVKTGDKVTLIGADGDERITVEELGNICGRFNYELVCDIGKRVPRVFVKDGNIIKVKDCFYHNI